MGHCDVIVIVMLAYWLLLADWGRGGGCLADE